MEPQAYVEMAEMQSTHWWFTARREILRSMLLSLDLPEGARILEVGSGTGANLELLSEFGEVEGLEMAAEAIEFAASSASACHGRVRMVQGRCPDDLGRLHGLFDLVCMFDVLEHIADDVGSLERLAGLLAPGGRILLTVPAYQWLWSSHDEHLHHHRRYTRGALGQTCATAGLAVQSIGHFNTLLFPLAVADRIATRLTGRASGGTKVPAAPVNKAFHRVFASERHVLGRHGLPFGLSLFALAAPS